jgi:hypothetical protein
MTYNVVTLQRSKLCRHVVIYSVHGHRRNAVIIGGRAPVPSQVELVK